MTTTGYTRQSAANISAGLAIQSADLNAEYNQLQSAFDNTTGHDHSGGATGSGQKIPLASAVSGALPVANGGTALTSGTSGGVLAFTGATTMASSAALTQYAVMIGGGPGAVPSVVASIGTATTVLHGNATGAPTFSAVALAADVSGSLPVTNGGTALTSGTSGGVLAFTGATTIASSALLTNNALMLGGGVGAAPKVVASLGTATTVLHGNATGAPTFGAVNLTTDVTGVLPPANGGASTTVYANLSAQVGPLSITGSTLKMSGFTQTITPTGSGKILIIISGDTYCTVNSNPGSMTLRYGTGAAPANNAALTGTAAATTKVLGFDGLKNANAAMDFAINTIITGLTLSTAYWIDMAIAGGTGPAVTTIENINLSIVEFI